jgi:CubicO group peptidase (beta-lactamase class C family)
VLVVSSAHADARRSLDALLAPLGGTQAPGCSLGVLQNGRVVYERAFGMADLERSVPLTSRSVFDIGSTSKQMTAMSIVLLAEEGKLSLDDDVRKWIPELPSLGKPITLAHLLHHTSGIRDYIDLLNAAGVSVEDAIGDDEALAILARQRGLQFATGTKWGYSNSNYFLLSLVVRRAAGVPLAEFERRRIFQPLGMNDTHVHVDHTRLVPNRAIGYEPRTEGGFKILMSNWEQSGDGAVHTTVADLARWDENFYSAKVGGQHAIELLTTPGKLDDGRPLEYALGLVVGHYRGLPLVEHAGEWAGYRAQLLRFPTAHLSTVCLCNHLDSDPGELALHAAEIFLADRLGPPDAAPAASAKPASAAAPKTVPPMSPSELAALAGIYYSQAEDDLITYTVRAGHLNVQIDDKDVSLDLIGPREFRRAVPSLARIHRFEPIAGAGWRVRLISPLPTESELVFERVRPAETAIGEYAGTYQSTELGTSYVLTERDGQLQLRVRDRAPAPLKPVAADIFRFNQRLIRLVRNSAHRVIGLRLGDLVFDRSHT